MSSDNETVAEVAAHYRAIWQGCEGVSLSEHEGIDVLELVDRFEAAHNREIAAKVAEIAKLNAKCKEYERQPELMAETAREALRTLQEQDAVIAELRERIKEADEFAAEMKHSINSLVRACGHQMILRLHGEGGNDAH